MSFSLAAVVSVRFALNYRVVPLKPQGDCFKLGGTGAGACPYPHKVISILEMEGTRPRADSDGTYAHVPSPGGRTTGLILKRLAWPDSQGNRMKPLCWAIKGHKRDVGTRFCVSAFRRIVRRADAKNGVPTKPLKTFMSLNMILKRLPCIYSPSHASVHQPPSPALPPYTEEGSRTAQDHSESSLSTCAVRIEGTNQLRNAIHLTDS
jgi:hypothetical protein